MGPAPFAPIPSALGRYDILDRLAFGGMAEIFLAREHGHAGLERLVVVKRILPHLAADPDFIEMFLQEARVVARLNHPHVVQIHELGEVDGAYFIAMEYLEGSSVRDVLAQAARLERPLPLGCAIAIVTQACLGAHAAHELTDQDGSSLGLVHRDISPHNLMVSAQGHVKLLDFGIAKATERALDLTRTGGLKGKLHYLSPEQCEHKKLDRRSDVFALGVVLWELITNQRLFKRDSELATMQAIVEGEIPDARALRPDLPERLVRVLDRALAVRRDDRFESADALRHALLAAAESARLDVSIDALAEVVRALCGESQQRTRLAVRALLDRAASALDPTVRQQAPEDTTGSVPLWKTLTGSIVGSRGTPGSASSTATGPAARAAARSRRRILLARSAAVLGSLVVASVVLLWALRPAPVVLSGAPIVVGFAPSYDPTLVQREFEPLRLYLERSTGRPVRFPVTTSYLELARQLLDGEISLAFVPPNLYLETHAQEPRVQPLLVALYGGGRGNDGVLLVREDSPITTLEQLRGTRLCYPDPDSTSGYLMPRLTLRQAGIDPDRALLPARISGNHLQAMRDLIDGRCDAAGTFSNAYRTADQAGIPVTTLRVLTITGRAPHDALCSGPRTPAEDAALIVDALLQFDPQRELGTKWLGDVQRLSGYERIADEDFDSLRQAIAQERAHEARTEDGGTEDAPHAALP
ncbi:MAG: serine/threonine-protein kinase [Pseudomonadota bacterium]